jgi:hypothetical protein
MTELVPRAIDALVALARTALPDVQVFDGPVTDWPEQEYVAVGLSPDTDETPSTRATAGLEAYREMAEVVGMVRVWTGDDEIRPTRERAYVLLGALRQATDSDPRLGGAVTQCQLVDHTYAPGASDQGRWVDLLITWRAVQL